MSIESKFKKETDPLFKNHEALPDPEFDKELEYLENRKNVEEAGYQWRDGEGRELPPLNRDIQFLFTRIATPADIEIAKSNKKVIIPFDSTGLDDSIDLPTYIVIDEGTFQEEDIKRARDIIKTWYPSEEV
jgi:hypothetical protein